LTGAEDRGAAGGRSRRGARASRRAVVGLGANLGDRARTLEAAVEALAATPGVELRARSPFYETEPVGGPPGQPAFLNGAVLVKSRLGPRPLLERLLEIERSLGRIRRERWGPRTVDLDLLWMEDVELAEPGLTVPHPRLLERAFALRPLLDVLPDAPPSWHERLARADIDFPIRRTSSTVATPAARPTPSAAGEAKGAADPLEERQEGRDTMADDTRRERRAPIAARVRYRSPISDAFVEHESVDLSAGGVFIGTREPLEVGTLLKFEILLGPGAAPEDADAGEDTAVAESPRVVDGVGRVVWVRSPMTLSTADQPPGMGVKFVKLSPEDRERLAEAIERRVEEVARYEEGASPEDLVPSDPPAVGLADEAAQEAASSSEAPAFGGARASSAPPPDDRAASAAPPPAQDEDGDGTSDPEGPLSPPVDALDGPEDPSRLAASSEQPAEETPPAGLPAEGREGTVEPPLPSEAAEERPPAAGPALAPAGAAPTPAPREQPPPPEPEPFPRPEEPGAPGWLLSAGLILAGSIALGIAFWLSFSG